MDLLGVALIDGKGNNDHGTCRSAFHDQDPGVPGDGLLGPGSEGLGATADRKQHLAQSTGRDRDGHPPDRPHGALRRIA